RRMAGDAQLPAEVEQLVLDARQQRMHRLRHPGGDHHADAGVGLVDGAVGFDPERVLARPAAVAQAGAAVVAGAGIDLREAVAHRAQRPSARAGTPAAWRATASATAWAMAATATNIAVAAR